MDNHRRVADIVQIAKLRETAHRCPALQRCLRCTPQQRSQVAEITVSDHYWLVVNGDESITASTAKNPAAAGFFAGSSKPVNSPDGSEKGC
jgi:hypothetical protein